ncbi:CDP-glucose 4,6-dehydratase [Thiorhodovibrio litoralis]|uniref:CDP-glucose 4,6-dehydratase n=1 Tax=Thiorhodovibrio litoralis TaxID=2952932 RepID=UPI002B25E923|nr:CDP-glucose 4,6-dehydratase [Thiorhodovibrio litoralis]WPL10437.1 CDP-glucose 4,6-dehydratase [Thiorhodovibrio litoralis]
MPPVRAPHPFWSAKRVVLTGHTGFKGGWLALWLQQLGAEVTGYALEPPTAPNLFDVAQVCAGMTSVIADIRDLPRLQQTLSEARPEIVFHLAAQPLVRYGYRNPVETYATNVMGTVHLLEAVRQTSGVRAVVIVTSDKCYENREWVWGYREDEPMGGQDPYSNSKGCAELIARAYRDSYFNAVSHAERGVAIASARAGNVIGGGDWAADRLIPDLLRAIRASEPAVIRAPHAIRPWQHVLEPLSGYLRLAERLYCEGSAYAEPWNFGPNDEDTKPVQWVVERLTRIWGQGARWQLDPNSQPHEAHHLKLDCAKARARLDWSPCWPLAEAIRRVVAWQQALDAGADMRAWSLAEIADYMQAQATSHAD